MCVGTPVCYDEQTVRERVAAPHIHDDATRPDLVVEVPVRQHHPLGVAGAPRRVLQQRHVTGGRIRQRRRRGGREAQPAGARMPLDAAQHLCAGPRKKRNRSPRQKSMTQFYLFPIVGLWSSQGHKCRSSTHAAICCRVLEGPSSMLGNCVGDDNARFAMHESLTVINRMKSIGGCRCRGEGSRPVPTSAMPLDAKAPKRMARSAAEVVSAHAASQSWAERQANITRRTIDTHLYILVSTPMAPCDDPNNIGQALPARRPAAARCPLPPWAGTQGRTSIPPSCTRAPQWRTRGPGDGRR